MSLSGIAVFCSNLPGAEPVLAPKPEVVQRSVSVSRQFIIYAQDKTVRSRLSRTAEDMKTEWLRRLALQDEWQHPIVIQFQPSSRPPRNAGKITTRLYVADDNAPKVQIDVYDVSALKGPDFEREILRALMLELAYRQKPLVAGKSHAQPPEWLLEGMAEDIRYREGGLPAGLYDTLITQENPLKIEQLLKSRSGVGDATTQALFQAQSLALVRGLAQLPDGPAGLKACIQAIPESENSLKELVVHFPSLKSNTADISKIWTLSIARASASNRSDSLRAEETARQLAAILEIPIQVDPKKPDAGKLTQAQAVQVLARTDSGPYQLRQMSDNLLRLELRAHPLYRPLIQEYRNAFSTLAAKPKKNIEKRLTANNELLVTLNVRSKGIAEYMNWFEASRLDVPSGEFQKLSSRTTPAMQRNDAITRQLDDIESRGW